MTEPRMMGLGEAGSPELIHVRKFRWTLEGTHLPEHFMKSVKFDFKKQEIEFDYIEVVTNEDDIIIQKWLENTNFGTEKLTFTTYDGCGSSLYQYQFGGLTLLSDTASFDYADSDSSVRRVKLHYDEYKRRFLAHGEPSLKHEKKGFDWTASVEDVEFDVKVSSRPSLSIEETEVNFLNAKTWIAGKAEWERIVLTLSPSAEKKGLPTLITKKSFELKLHLWTRGRNRKRLETWTMSKAHLKSAKVIDGAYNLEISYSDVKYEQGNDAERKEG